MAKLVCLRIVEEDYSSFREMLPDELPPKFSDWLKQTVEDNKKAAAAGHEQTEIEVTPAGFKAYCDETTQRPSYTILLAHALAKSRRYV